MKIKIKFEQLLNLYWKKKFFISNNTIDFSSTLHAFKEVFGLNSLLLTILVKKIELNKSNTTPKASSLKILNWKKKRIINILLAKIFNINFEIIKLYEFQILRLILIKSWRGKSFLLNKPVRGQRTRSNNKSTNFFTKLIKKKLSILIKNNTSKIVDNKNYFIHIKKKIKKKKNFLKKKESSLKILLSIKKWI